MHHAAAPLNRRGSANCKAAGASIKAIKVKPERIWQRRQVKSARGCSVTGLC
jgi:hypothetical protein